MAQDEFQIALSSNVKSSNSNSPSSFMTRLAHPLIFEGQWEVALMDVTYYHEWFNFHQDYEFAIAMPLGDLDDDFLNGSFDEDVELIQSRTPNALRSRREAEPPEAPSAKRLRLIEPRGKTRIRVENGAPAETTTTRTKRQAASGGSPENPDGGSTVVGSMDNSPSSGPAQSGEASTQVTTTTPPSGGTVPSGQASTQVTTTTPPSGGTVPSGQASTQATATTPPSGGTAPSGQAPAAPTSYRKWVKTPQEIENDRQRARTWAELAHISADRETLESFENYENKKLQTDMENINMKNKSRLWQFAQSRIRKQEFTDLSTLVDDINDEISYIYDEIHPADPLGDGEMHLRYNKRNHGAIFNSDKTKFMLVAPANASIIHILGFGELAYRVKLFSGDEYDILYLEKSSGSKVNETIGPSPVAVRGISSMWVYSDIVEQSLVGDTQGNILGHFPILTKYGDPGFFIFPERSFLPVKFREVSTIEIMLCQDTGEPMPMVEGKTTCQLKFRRKSQLH